MTSWIRSLNQWAHASGRLGPLERRVLEALWARGDDAAVRDLQPDFPHTAYTTLMTTLDRLHRKGVLDRVKRGRAFVYRPRLTRVEFESALAADAFKSALDTDRASLTPLLSHLLEAVGDRDREMLSELESLVRSRREEQDEPS
jgi:predicted transcriptional regulator